MTDTTNPADQPPVVRATWVSRPPTEAFEVFTEEIGAWWPLPTHGVFGERAGGVAFRNGQLVEHAVDGSESVWGSVRVWEPPSRLVISWHPGRGAGEASEVEVVFEPTDDGTRVVLEHRGWEAFGAEAMARRRHYIGPGTWGAVLDHYTDGVEPRPDGADLAGLEAAYRSFLAEAERGGFGPAPDGEWDADHILAHVALNDAAMVAVCHAIVDRRNVSFENQTCQDPTVLAEWIKLCGDRDELIGRCRESARLVMAALGRLSPDQLATEVHCRLSHDGEVVLDEPRPWVAIAIETQATMHLPAHTGQLGNLRPTG